MAELKMIRHNSWLVFVCSTVLIGCSQYSNSAVPDNAETDINVIANEYHDLRLITPEAVYVDPQIARLCISPSQEMVELAREEHGVHALAAVKIYMNDLAADAF